MKNYYLAGAIFMVALLFLCVGCSTKSVSTTDKPKLFKLPDGSVMVLNRYSKAELDVNDETRNVMLTGEAYFEIKRADVPFEVHTPKGVIIVLGTEFNVHATEDELEVEVDEGQVEVKTDHGNKKLSKGERVFYDDVKKLLKKGKAEFKHHIWTDDFKEEMRQFGKDIEKGGKKLGKEIKNIGKDLKIKL